MLKQAVHIYDSDLKSNQRNAVSPAEVCIIK